MLELKFSALQLWKSHGNFRYGSNCIKLPRFSSGYPSQIFNLVILLYLLGDFGSGVCHTNCIFQTLVECLVGMKFSIVNHTEGLCLSILHQSSGNF